MNPENYPKYNRTSFNPLDIITGGSRKLGSTFAKEAFGPATKIAAIDFSEWGREHLPFGLGEHLFKSKEQYKKRKNEYTEKIKSKSEKDKDLHPTFSAPQGMYEANVNNNIRGLEIISQKPLNPGGAPPPFEKFSGHA